MGPSERTKFLAKKIVLDTLSRFTPEDLKYAIDNDIYIPHLLNKDQALLRTIKVLAGLFASKFQLFTTDNALLWLKKEKPELYATILNHPKGYIWFDKQIKGLKETLW